MSSVQGCEPHNDRVVSHRRRKINVSRLEEIDSRGLPSEMRKRATNEVRKCTNRQDDWFLNCFEERAERPSSRQNFAMLGCVL